LSRFPDGKRLFEPFPTGHAENGLYDHDTTFSKTGITQGGRLARPAPDTPFQGPVKVVPEGFGRNEQHKPATAPGR